MGGIRKYIYSKKNQDLLPSDITANAGADQFTTNINSITLDGTLSSSSYPGGITSYHWEIIQGIQYTLLSPDNVYCDLVGTSIYGSIIVQLTVKDASGNLDTDTVTVTITKSSTVLAINSSMPELDKTGTIDIRNGEPNEVLNLEFTLYGEVGDFVNVKDYLGASIIGVLDYLHDVRNGQVTMDPNGDGTYYYEGSTDGTMTVKIVQRSAPKLIPPPGSTTVDFSPLI